MKWFKIYRENGLIEIACEHGVGHPSLLLTPPRAYYATHGCCGCCTHAEWARAEHYFLSNAAFEVYHASGTLPALHSPHPDQATR